MAIQFQNRRGTTAESDNFTGASGEVTVDTTTDDLRVHDGTKQGGHLIESGLKNLFGVIRQSTIDTGWFYIDDTGHTPFGFDSITTNVANIDLGYSFTAEKVGTIVATTDETYAQYGLVCGASVNKGNCLLTIAAPFSIWVEEDGTLHLPTFFEGLVTADISLLASGKLKINHPTMKDGNVVPSVSPLGTTGPSSKVTLGFASTYTEITAVGNVDGYVYYDGAAWQYLGDLVNIPTFTFNGATGELLVTHDECAKNAALNVSSRSISARCLADSILTDTTFDVIFYDAAGSPILTPNSNMKFYFSREGSVRKKTLKGLFSINRGYAAVNHNKLASMSGNIWISGKHYV